MTRLLTGLVGLSLAAGCSGDDAAPQVVDGPVSDVRCPTSDPFGPAMALTELNYTSNELVDDYTASLTADERTIYFSSSRHGGFGKTDIFSAKRPSLTEPFAAPVRMPGVNTAGHDNRPMVTADGLTLYAEINGGTLEWNVAAATRASVAERFGAPVPVAELSSPSIDVAPFVIPDHSAIYFSSVRSGNSELYRATRDGGTISAPVLVEGLASPSQEDYPVLASGELEIIFSSDRAGGSDLWRAERATVTAPFGAPVAITELNTAGLETPGWLSPDSCRLYFARTTPPGANYDLYVATRQR
ncbi:MAG: PD40 domain-containing protein [Deltaproteobacteria bacterium]|nr:PD40 domain-containing protein [Deltaproteobacteria bacterium]